MDPGIDHGGAEHLMPQELLDPGDIHACVQQSRGAGMAQAVRKQRLNADRFPDLGDMTSQPIG